LEGLRIASKIRWAKRKNKVIVMNEKHDFLELQGPVAVELWRLLVSKSRQNKCTNMQELLEYITANYEVDKGTAHADIEELLHGLVKHEVLEQCQQE